MGILIWISGKWLQKGKFLFQKYRVAGTVFFLEGGLIEPLQFLLDRCIHGMKVKKFPVPQTGNDVRSQIPNTSLYGCLVTRGQYPGGKQCGLIVICQLLVRAVYDWIFVFSIAEDPDL